MARICPHCGTRQSPWSRWALRIVGVLSAASVLLSLITVAVSFFPQAWVELFPKEEVRLLEVAFDSLDIGQRKQARTRLANLGNQDLFIIRVRLEPADKALAEVPSYNYLVNEWLRVSENRLILNKHDPRGGEYFKVPVARFPDRYRELAEAKIKNCFVALVHPTDLYGSVSRPEDGAVGSVFAMKAIVYYSSKESGGEMRDADQELTITATLMYRAFCEKRLENYKKVN